MDYGEDPESAVSRELQEETGLLISSVPPRLICVKGHPKRDPRQHVVTIAYEVVVDPSSMDKLKG